MADRGADIPNHKMMMRNIVPILSLISPKVEWFEEYD
jgi:hypothetical protein